MKNIILGIVAGVGLIVAVVLGARSMSSDSSRSKFETNDATVHFICEDDQAGWSVSFGELGRMYKNNIPLVCPECGSDQTPIPAFVCGHCKKYGARVGHDQLPETCPNCGEKLTRPTE